MVAFVFRLTKQEQTVVAVVLLLLLTGLAVKAYRTAHPQAVPNGQTNLENHAAN